jgi:hypothetical protein
LKRRVIEAFLEVLYSTKKEPAMTHQEDCPVLDHVMTLLIEHGPGAMANAFTIIMNLAMQIEREQTLKSRVSSENGRPSRLRQRIQAQDHPHPVGRGAVAYPADPARKWGRERFVLRGIPRQGLEFAPVPDYRAAYGPTNSGGCSS